MPIVWNRSRNPYRVNYFGILRLGPKAQPREISSTRKDITRKIQGGKPHIIETGGKEPVAISEAEANEAESRLLDEHTWATEILLVHPVPDSESKRLSQICTLIQKQVQPQESNLLRLTVSEALAALLPEPSPNDVVWPTWEELGISNPLTPEDSQYDIQFDL